MFSPKSLIQIGEVLESKKGEKIMASKFEYRGLFWLNIDATVGSTGVNQHDDVYLIQVFLRELLTIRYKGTIDYHGDIKPPPFPTGVFTVDTQEALGIYKQIKNNASKRNPAGNLKVYYDKNIDPIVGNIFAFGTQHPWAIVQMQGEITDMLLMNNIDGSLESYLYGKYPELMFMFRQ
jgi:hypothetical protein